jgi:hypothetical protein
VTIQVAAIGFEIKYEHEGSVHELSGRDLDARVAVAYPKIAEERLIGHRTSF